MDLFIYLQIGSIDHINFTHPIQEWVKKNYQETLVFDADNHSDGIVTSYGLEQIKQAQTICVMIEAQPNKKLGGITSLIEKIIRVKDKSVMVFVSGENEMLKKMLSFSKNQVHCSLSNPEIQLFIRNDF